jgi:gamma-glutamylputrescine oxidase
MKKSLPNSQVLWLEDTPVFPHLEPPKKTSIAVIGAGISGLSVALHLQRAGLEVTLIEKDTPAFGASGRNVGHQLTGTSEYYARAVEVMGREKARDVWAFTVMNQRELNEEIDAIRSRIEYHRTGYLACATTVQERRELEKSVQLLNEDGFFSEYWTRDQLVKRTGDTPFLGARYSPDDAILQPAWLVWALVERFVQGGGCLLPFCEVTDVKEKDGQFLTLKWQGAEREMQADALVWCLNAWTSELLPAFADRIAPVRAQVLATQSMHKVCALGMAANFGYEYWRQAQRGEFVLGGWRWAQEDAENNARKHDPSVEVHEGLETFMRSSFPKLKDAEIRQIWTGQMGFSQDGLPWVGAVPGRTGQFISAGFTGHGLGLAWSCGRCLAEEMQSGRLHADLRWFRASR